MVSRNEDTGTSVIEYMSKCEIHSKRAIALVRTIDKDRLLSPKFTGICAGRAVSAFIKNDNNAMLSEHVEKQYKLVLEIIAR